MRGMGPRARSPVTIDVRTFGWDRALLATLRHSTLSLESVDAIPLSSLRDAGKRDRLSLLGQFAAQQALLQFAGVADGAFDPSEWVVVQRRGADCRLVRIRGRRPAVDPIPILTIVQQFADAIGAPAVDVLRQSSARAEAVYCEIDGRLRNDATADLRWFRAAAAGSIASPGVDGLRAILATSSGRYRFDDVECLVTLAAAADDLLLFGDQASPLERFSGIAALETIAPHVRTMTESEVVERVIDTAARQRLLFAIASTESLDAASRKVIDLLQASGTGVWISGADGIELPDSAWFVVSPRLSAHQELQSRIAEIPRELRRAKVDEFIAAPCFERYLVDGIPPSPQLASPAAAVKEPLRSYLAAMALLGAATPAAVAQSFLDRLSSAAKIDELLVEGVTTLTGGTFAFVSENMRTVAAQHLPAASRAALSRTAAETLEEAGSLESAALLFADSGDIARAMSIFESIAWASADDAMRALQSVRPENLSPRLAQTLVCALIDAGRYRDAHALLPRIAGEDRELLAARIERRTGDYAPALARLERIGGSFRAALLRGELLSLTGRLDEAAAAYAACTAAAEDERLLLGYQRAVLAIDSGTEPGREWMESSSPLRDYYAARFHTYDAIAAYDTAAARAWAAQAVAAARTMADRIDATLDSLFVLFTAGNWPEAHAAALDALLLVDETQGDRAAGGILFMLAFLCADEGQCAHAAHLLDRLRLFYGEVHDGRRLHELHLISAAIELARAQFDAARSAAESLLAQPVSDQIREAAALIADEAVLLTGADGPRRARGDTANIELTDRWALLRGAPGIRRPFLRDLASWTSGAPPAASTTSDKLMLMRSALRRGQPRVAEAVASELEISLEAPPKPGDIELRTLRIAASREYPFEPHAFAPAKWRFATRNRLGQWNEIGSAAALPPAELDRILQEGADDWVPCSDRELLYFEGIGTWTPESRSALAATFRIRAEHLRLRRLSEQEEALPVRTLQPLDGIVGQSPAIAEICSLVSRIARRDVPVCILGESGTGKELVAHAIHRQSGRRQKAFTTVNCAALPDNLIESELFGSARGAFTGADRDRAGLIEASDGGTLFLDEIGEMPLAAQAKLLRFLQEGEFRRIGETLLRSADVRVLAATNRKLENAVESGRFREDLYYRVRGIELTIPPLRDRPADIPLLAAHFLAREREKHRGGPSRLSAEAEAAFASYHWPGNVRELQNAIRAAHAVAGEAKVIDLEHLPEALRRIRIVRKSIGSYQDALIRFRRDLIEKSLAQANGNQNQAAAMLKISRQALAYQIRELGILVTPSKRPPV